MSLYSAMLAGLCYFSLLLRSGRWNIVDEQQRCVGEESRNSKDTLCKVSSGNSSCTVHDGGCLAGSGLMRRTAYWPVSAV